VGLDLRSRHTQNAAAAVGHYPVFH
jgi:hypothetical protein